MTIEDPHPSDQELLLAADGELSSRCAASVRAHLAGCWACRARMSELEATIRDFIELHRSGLGPHLPAAAGPRALLKAQLAELAGGDRGDSPLRLFPLSFARTVAVWSVLTLKNRAGLAGCLQPPPPGRDCGLPARRGLVASDRVRRLW